MSSEDAIFRWNYFVSIHIYLNCRRNGGVLVLPIQYRSTQMLWKPASKIRQAELEKSHGNLKVGANLPAPSPSVKEVIQKPSSINQPPPTIE
jgi:hypothetical protein